MHQHLINIIVSQRPNLKKTKEDHTTNQKKKQHTKSSPPQKKTHKCSTQGMNLLHSNFLLLF
eukprot:m.261435 g.261435  ORF g.261435 m.261435 type:complete len:62 (+) comp42155_c0_seq1:1692-1877(+)